MWWLLACTDSISLSGPPVESIEAVPEGEGWVVCEGTPAVRLNEFIAANHHGLQDGDAETNDWIELVAGEGEVDLHGWSLGDDPDHAWPLSGQLGPTPLLVWASGKNRTVPDVATDFSISATNPEIFLRAPEGCVADYANASRLYADVSYGRTPAGAWEYFLDPTPGAANNPESRPGFAAMPSMSPPGGFVSDTTVSITGSNVRFTSDGAVPTEASSAYGDPIELSESVVALRAVAFESGLWPSRPATETYFLSADLLETGVRIIALTAEPDDLFDPETGIYMLGPEYEPWYPYFGANFWELWERDVHIEYFAPDGSRGFAQDAGIQIAGGYSRAFDQRNFEIIARSGYGPDTFASALFDDEDIDSFTRLYLRNGGDWCSTQLVDGLVQSLFRNADGSRNALVDAQAYEPALVYINGEFWGLYELKERLDESYAQAHHGADPEALDRVKVGWTHDANWELEQGSWEAFNQLDAMRGTDLSGSGEFAAFDALVDLPNFAAAQVAQGWIGNSDWWYNNIRMWRPTPDGEFRWMVYDFGHGFPVVGTDHLATTVNGSWMGLPVGDALTNQGFRDLFVNVHADFLNTSLRGEAAAANLDALAAEIRPVIGMQRERWCGGANLNAWESAIEAARRFAQNRGTVVERTLHEHMALGNRIGVRLQVEPASAGTIALTAVTVEDGFEGTYYDGVPLQLSAQAAAGYQFSGWSGASESASSSLTITPAGDMELTANFESK